MKRVTTVVLEIPDALKERLTVAEATHIPHPQKDDEWHLFINGALSTTTGKLTLEEFRKLAMAVTGIAFSAGYLQETISVQVTFVAYLEAELTRQYRLSFGVGVYVGTPHESRLGAIVDDDMTIETTMW